MRTIYIDEAGISEQEETTLVAAAIVESDSQVDILENRLDKIRRKYFPGELDVSFALHATDIFSGTKYIRSLGLGLEERLPILDEILRIPKLLRIPIAYGFVKKNRNIANASAALRHATAMAFCLDAVERYLRVNAPSERAITICEDTPASRRILREIQNGMRSGEMLLQHSIGSFNKISGPLHFASKNEVAALQLVDACVFATTRWINKAKHHKRQIETLHGPIDEQFIRKFQGPAGQFVGDWFPRAEYAFGSIFHRIKPNKSII